MDVYFLQNIPTLNCLQLQKKIIKKNNDKVSVIFWGTGNPRREFLHSGDLASACLFVFENLDFKDLVDDQSKFDRVVKDIRNTHINIGTGKDISIKELVELAGDIIGFKGNIGWDSSLPDGTGQKLMDVSKINALGWKESVSLRDGIKLVYDWYVGSV